LVTFSDSHMCKPYVPGTFLVRYSATLVT